MNGVVTIGSKEVGMTANAASPYLYKKIFRKDFIRETQAKTIDTDIFGEMGFVMAKQAEKKKMSDLLALTENDFMEWLSDFGSTEILEASEEIINLYMGQTVSSSVPKTEGD